MSVAPRAAPSMSDKSKILSRRGSVREEEELAVGAVMVMLSDKTSDQNAAAYRLPTGENGQDDIKTISPCFMAVLAPSCDTAMASLQSQPPGTYLLVKEEDAAITVYVKFRQAVRSLTLVKGKEVKKNDDAIQLAKLRKKDLDVLMQTPVHNLRLSSEAYLLVKHCWKRFLPQVQVVVFELCCESHLDEETKLEDWTCSMIPSSSYSLCLMPEACGFFILTASATGADVSTSNVIQIRQVEFDFNKYAITVADGTLKPSALLLPTSFASKRSFEAGFTFSAIRDNFLSPDLVILKETQLNLHLSQPSSLLNCIDVSSNDNELAVLTAFESICSSLLPHEPLPDSFLIVLHEMHIHFENSGHRFNTTPKATQWSAPKMKLVGRIIPILVELLIASAAFSESRTNELMDAYAIAAENKKKETFAHFAHSMRFDILFMVARSDDSVMCRLTHQLCQLLGARIRLPAELVDFIRDLTALFPIFLRLFLRNQGIGTLWRNLYHNDQNKDDDTSSSDSRASRTFRSFRALQSSKSVVNLLHRKRERKSSFFGLARTPVTKSRKSLSLGTNLSTSSFLSSKALAFFRLSPLSVHIYLGTQLRDGYFTFPDIWREDSTLINITFCCCNGVSRINTSESSRICARQHLKSSAKVVTFELILQLSLCFLYHKTSFENWDRDVALLLRLEDIHQHLCNEIIDLVQRQSKHRDVKKQEAIFCELRVTIACASTLFRLERKRRQEMSSVVGEKKYLSFIYSFRSKLRALNERLKSDVNCDQSPIVESEVNDGVQTEDSNNCFLQALAEVLKWIPRVLLDEWIVLFLKELLQTVNLLSKAVKNASLPQLKQLQHIRDIHEIFQVFTVMLKRASDLDIQTILVRAMGMDSSSIISLLRFALSPHSLSLNGGRDAVSTQAQVLNFLNAFVNLDIALPVQIEWESKNRKQNEDGSLDEDAEIIEKLKGELLIRVLGPRITSDDSDQTLWEYLQELMFPEIGSNTVASSHTTSRMISIAVTFRSECTPPIPLTGICREDFQLKEAFFLLQQALYTAQDASSSVDYANCVTSHLRRIEQYCDRMIDNKSGQEERDMVYRMVKLNFRCLIVLASRRSQFPEIQEAFNRARVLSRILKRLQPPKAPHHDPNSAQSQSEQTEPITSDESDSVIFFLPRLKIPSQFNTGRFDGLNNSIMKLPLLTPALRVAEVNMAEHFILAEPGLHVLALVLLTSFVIGDPNLEIDDKLCPRISVPGHTETDSIEPRDLLWTLQQHLATVEMDARYFEALMVEMDTLLAFVSTARLSAIRLLLRLLCPNHFDYNLYTTQEGDYQPREYIAKGAFSTVYRQHPALPRPEAVAVKVVEHQRREGELCAISGLFNEVSILSKLRGDLAATQLVDFGNHHTEQNFEIVMEYCPCSLTEWRNTIKRSDSDVPFRSCLVMILRTFDEACQGLTRIHKANICHFDIKSDNILVRSSARELSRKLLENDEEDEAPISEYKGWICFADFGEAKIVDAASFPVRTFTFSSLSSGNAVPVVVQKQAERFMSLSRTRGTEAIKSPEVLNIKGSEQVSVKVTLASDIWSLGCLLYELVTQELLFQNDDWANLYAHLVVTHDQPVLRSDHKEKMFTALQPSCNEEEAAISSLFELCSKILVREPTNRPSLKTITSQARKLLFEVYKLPMSARDESFIISLNEETHTPEAPRSMSTLQPFTTPRRKCTEKHDVIVPVRLFWNFFLTAQVAETVADCLGTGYSPAFIMDTFESKYEAEFVHFVYLNFHESATQPENLLSGVKIRDFIHEIHEEKHRTCFYFNSSVNFQQIIQYAPVYFPVLQRLLRDEAGRIIFVALGQNTVEMKELNDILIEMLFFFLRGAFNLSPFDILSYFARDCAQFFAYPRPEFLLQLTSYSVSKIEDSATLTFVSCQCGANVLSVESTVLFDASASQTCTCNQVTNFRDCACFHPFSTDEVDDDDNVFPVDCVFEYEFSEEQLVLPFETRSKRQDEVQWVSVDSSTVKRSDGGVQVPIVYKDSERRASRFEKLTGRAKVAAEVKGAERTANELLVKGLQHRGKPSDASSDSWELFECPLCRLPLCALCEGKVAVPMLHY